MKRREALLKFRLIGIVMFGIGLISSCTNTPKEETTIVEEALVVEEVEVLSPRDSLIINRQIMVIADTENPTDFELKHSPEITLGENGPKGFTQVNVSIGQKGIIHPVEENHWVDFISLYADDKKVGHIEYEAGMSRGYASFYISTEGVSNITAEAGCNLHGIWKSAISL